MSKRPNFWASLYPKFEVLSQNRQNIVRYAIVILVDTSRKYLILNINIGQMWIIWYFSRKLQNIGWYTMVIMVQTSQK